MWLGEKARGDGSAEMLWNEIVLILGTAIKKNNEIGSIVDMKHDYNWKLEINIYFTKIIKNKLNNLTFNFYLKNKRIGIFDNW